MDGLRVELTWLYDLLNLGDDTMSCCGHICIEISCGLVELEITHSICSFCFYEGEICEKGLLLEVFLAFEDLGWFGVRYYLRLDSLICFLVFDDIASSFYNSSDSCGSVEGGDASSSGSDFFREGALRAYF